MKVTCHNQIPGIIFLGPPGVCTYKFSVSFAMGFDEFVHKNPDLLFVFNLRLCISDRS